MSQNGEKFDLDTSDKRGFTLTELLIVISIIAMLLSILIPALTRAREQSKRLDCEYHLKQLTLAWNMYAVSNGDRLCSPDAGSSAEGTWASNDISWCLASSDKGKEILELANKTNDEGQIPIPYMPIRK
ncbi:MAG: type II secretion system protein [Phycisphaerales bacterium]